MVTGQLRNIHKEKPIIINESFPFIFHVSTIDFDELSFDDGFNSSVATNVSKSEPPTDISDLSFEQIMVNDTNVGDRLNYIHEDSSTNGSFHESHPSLHTPSLVNNDKAAHTYSLLSQTNEQHSVNSTNPMIQHLQMELLRKQIEVQELMATELKVKIERTKQLMQMDAQESELRCQEISKRLQYQNNP